MIDLTEDRKFHLATLAAPDGNLVIYLSPQAKVKVTPEQYERLRAFLAAQSKPKNTLQ